MCCVTETVALRWTNESKSREKNENQNRVKRDLSPPVERDTVTVLRWGMACFGIGLFVACVASVTAGVTLGCTDVGCAGAGPTTLAVRGISLSGIAVFDGCNTCVLNPAVVGGVGLSLAGVGVGSVGIVGDLAGEK